MKEIEFPSPMADLADKASLVIHSEDLFGKEGRLVLIKHNDGWYRLMITKQRKLILTK
jgi:hemin uptake protein HemP